MDQVDSEPVRQIRWKEALKRMETDNLGLQQSQRMLKDAQKLTRRQWLSLVPRTAAFLNVSQGIASITDFDGDDLNASVVTNFNIPNPFDFYGALYGAELQKLEARWSSELDRRRAFADMYSAFVEAELLREEEAVSKRRRQVLLGGNPSDVSKALNNFTRENNNMERRRMTHRENVNRLLNTPGFNWDLVGDLPRLSYRERFDEMKVGNNFGKLALNLYAIRIESAILRTEQIKFRQWPAINFGLSNPPLYSSNVGSDITGEDFVMFSGVSKSLDLTDLGGRENIRDADYRLKLTREQVRQTMEREASRLHQMRNTYAQLLKEERHSQASLKRLSNPVSSEVQAVIKDLELRSEIETQLILLGRQIKQLDLQYLIWDELFWKS